jgi:hypothetical protein
MQHTCDLMVADVPTLNGRVYSMEDMKNIECQMIEMVAKGRGCVELGHGSREGIVHLMDVCGLVESVELTDRFHFNIKVIDTPPGNAWQCMIDARDCEFDIVPRVTGDLRYVKLSVIDKAKFPEKKNTLC